MEEAAALFQQKAMEFGDAPPCRLHGVTAARALAATIYATAAIRKSTGNREELEQLARKYMGNFESSMRTLGEDQHEVETQQTDKEIVQECAKHLFKGSNTFDQIYGMKKEKQRLENDFLLPIMFGSKVPQSSGMLMYGPPGTGKTYLMKALANHMNQVLRKFGYDVLMFHVDGAELKQKGTGDSEKKVESFFRCVRAQTGKTTFAIIFIDEVDAIATKRDEDNVTATRGLVNMLLTNIQGIDTKSSLCQNENASRVIIIANTNVYERVDPAFRARLRGEMYVGLPSQSDIVKQLKSEFEKQLYGGSNEIAALVNEQFFAYGLPADIGDTGPLTIQSHMDIMIDKYATALQKKQASRSNVATIFRNHVKKEARALRIGNVLINGNLNVSNGAFASTPLIHIGDTWYPAAHPHAVYLDRHAEGSNAKMPFPFQLKDLKSKLAECEFIAPTRLAAFLGFSEEKESIVTMLPLFYDVRESGKGKSVWIAFLNGEKAVVTWESWSLTVKVKDITVFDDKYKLGTVVNQDSYLFVVKESMRFTDKVRLPNLGTIDMSAMGVEDASPSYAKSVYINVPPMPKFYKDLEAKYAQETQK